MRYVVSNLGNETQNICVSILTVMQKCKTALHEHACELYKDDKKS